MTEGDRCDCGAPRREGAEWCPRCLERYDRRGPEEDDMAVFRFQAPRLRFSRTDEGPLSFGLIGRALLTGLVALPAAYGVFDTVIYWGTGRMLLNIIWVPVALAVTVWLSRSIWARVQVPPRQSLPFGDDP